MDYRLYLDPISQQPRVKVDAEHAAIGHYLSEEMVDDKIEVQQLVRRLRQNEDDWRLQGREWLLSAEDGAISLTHNSLLSEDDDVTLPDELLSTDSAELTAICGREDFLHLMDAWLSYLSHK